MLINKSVILAAGASERLGVPKALIQAGGMTLIERVALMLNEVGLSVNIVTRLSLVDSIRELIPYAKIIVNPNPEYGRTGSLQCALGIIGDGPLIMAPVDRPGFSKSTLELLCQKDETACPIRKDRGGHPIAISSKDIGAILRAEPDTPLRDIITPRRIEVEDPHLHLNVDTREDVELLLKVVSDLDNH